MKKKHSTIKNKLLNRNKLNTIILIIYFMIALAYSTAKAVYHESSMYLLISLQVIFAFIYYKINSARLNLLYCLGLSFVFLAGIFHVKTDFASLAYGTSFYFMFNTVIFLLLARYTFKKSLMTISMWYAPLVIIFFVFQSISYASKSISPFSVILFFMQLFSIVIIANLFYRNTTYKSSFFLLFGIFSLFACYTFGGINKIIIQNPYYSFIDNMAFAVGLYFITRAITVEDFYALKA